MIYCVFSLGSGELLWSSGKHFEGLFQDGQQRGPGRMKLVDKKGETTSDVFEGEWQDLKINGFGTIA